MRLFIASPIPEEVRTQIEEKKEEWKSEGCSGRFVAGANLHITLAFIGEVSDPEKVQTILNIMNRQPFPETVLKSGQLKLWRSLLVCQFESDEILNAWVTQLRNSLKDAGISVDEKPFKAHLTLARDFKSPDQVLPVLNLSSVRLSRAVLYESLFRDGKLQYIPVSEDPE